jgi:hypothetical protein
VPRHANDVNDFHTNDNKDITTTPTIHHNGLVNGNGILSDTKKSWSQSLISADGSRSVHVKTTKKYKKSINSTNNVLNNGVGSTAQNNNGNNGMNSAATAAATVCNGIRKERSLHYCSICSKGFKDKYSVNVHIRTHTGEKVIISCSHYVIVLPRHP